MNTTRLISAAAIALASLAAAGSAFAEGPFYEPITPRTSELTRAQVIAQIDSSRAFSAQLVSEAGLQPRFVAQRSRAEVRAETQLAQQRGEISALLANGHGFDGPLQQLREDNTRLARLAR